MKTTSNTSPQILNILGDIHLRKSNMQKAADFYLEYLKRYPFAPHASDLRAFILIHKVKEAQENNN